jgi:hypothetical protein
MNNVVGPIEVGEVKVVQFDFSTEAADNATLITPSVTCVVVEGTDPNPSAVLSGTPSVIGLVVTQLVRPGVVGCKYKLRAYASEASGTRHGITAYMKVANG